MTGTPPITQWLRAVAYHEAGHAVISRYEGISVEIVSIAPDETSAGRVTHKSPTVGRELEYDTSAHTQRRAETAVRILLAGGIAQRLFDARTYRHYNSRSDNEHALHILSNLAGPDEEIRAYWRLLQIQTTATLRQDFIWEAVAAVAEALLKSGTLSSDALDEIVSFGGDEERIIASLTETEALALLAFLKHANETGSVPLPAHVAALQQRLRFAVEASARRNRKTALGRAG